eukprot:PITA_15578
MSNYEKEASIRPTIFDGSNFVYWKVRIIAYLQSLGTEVWDIMEIGYTFPSATPIDMASKKHYETNAKVVNTLLGSLSQSEFVKVMQRKTAKEIWDKIIMSYEGDDQFESKVSTIEEKQDLQSITMSQLHEILTTFKMRKGGPLDRREAAFKASGKGDYNESRHMSEGEEESNFAKNLNRVLEDLEVSYLSNALLVEVSVTMQPSVLTKTSLTKREHGAPLTLTDVKYVPGLKKNLVSISMLEDKGYDVVFCKGKVFLRHIGTGQTKRIGIPVKNLYKLEVDDCVALSSKVEMVQSQDVGELWHRRLGHLNHGALKIMQQISTGLPKGKLEQTNTCKGCTLGKYVKSSFPDQDSRAGEILEQFHSDIWGPFSTASTTKQRYYVIFVDDFSRRC